MLNTRLTARRATRPPDLARVAAVRSADRRRRCCCSRLVIVEHRPARDVRRSRRRRAVGRAQRRRRRGRNRGRLGGAIAPACGPATCCSPSTASRSSRATTCSRCSSGRARGDRHTYTLLRLGSREVAEVAMAPLPSGAGALYYVLAAVGIFTLLVGAAVRTRRPVRSGDAALLLARGRVLRRVHVLVHRPLRSRRLVLLLGRRSGAADAAAALPALRARVSRAPAARTATRRCWRAGCRRSTCRPRCSRRRASSRSCARTSIPAYFVRLIGLLDRLEFLLPGGVPGRRSGRAGARAAAACGR